MARLVRLTDVWRMLDNCLPGYEPLEKPHHWAVKYRGRIYPKLPLGPHGPRRNPETFAGHVRSLVKFFEIPSDCVSKYVDLT